MGIGAQTARWPDLRNVQTDKVRAQSGICRLLGQRTHFKYTHTFNTHTHTHIKQVRKSYAHTELIEVPTPRGDDLCFLQYTSGSTSAPKGVCVSNDNLVRKFKCLCLSACVRVCVCV